MNESESTMHGCHEWHHHGAMRTLTAVIIAIFVFWCGFEFGLIRGSLGHGFEAGYGPSMMRGWDTNVMYGTTYGNGVMLRSGGTSVAPAAPAANAPTAK